MQTYIKLYTFTDQGQGADRVQWLDALRATAERMGGRVRPLYWTQGHYDAVGLEEWPDEDAAMAFTLIVADEGGARSETLVAFGEHDMQRIGAEWPACRHRAGEQSLQPAAS